MPFYSILKNVQNSENLGIISFVTNEMIEKIKVVRFLLDEL
jgi:hypothetical protein